MCIQLSTLASWVYNTNAYHCHFQSRNVVDKGDWECSLSSIGSYQEGLQTFDMYTIATLVVDVFLLYNFMIQCLKNALIPDCHVMSNDLCGCNQQLSIMGIQVVDHQMMCKWRQQNFTWLCISSTSLFSSFNQRHGVISTDVIYRLTESHY